MQVHEFAQPFAPEGDEKVGVLFLHGFTATPYTLREWATRTAEAGYRVAVPRLPGHGTSWRELEITDGRDWYAAAERAFLDLRAVCPVVFVAGLSMGGALALRLAEQYAAVRADPDPQAGWARWREARAELFATHPQSPVPADERAGYAGPFTYDYDPAWRLLAEVRPAEPEHYELPSSDGATMSFTRFATEHAGEVAAHVEPGIAGGQGGGPVPVERPHVEAGLPEPSGHRQPHVADPDDAHRGAHPVPPMDGVVLASFENVQTLALSDNIVRCSPLELTRPDATHG